MRYGQAAATPNDSLAEDCLPVFVYGTLRNSQGNYFWALEGRTTSELPSFLDNADMYGRGRGFPYVADGTGSVRGELMYIDAQHYTDVLSTLDGLEGYRGPGLANHYDRMVRSVRLDDGSHVAAWVYLLDPVRAGRFSDDDRIITGDWPQQSPARETCSQCPNTR